MNHLEIWAKTAKRNEKSISLAEHTKDVLETYEKIWQELKTRIAFPDSILGEVYSATRAAIVCHDLGKVLPSFQLFTLRNKSYSLGFPPTQVPHSLFSALLVNKDTLREKVGDSFRFVLSSVAYHHWRERFFELVAYPSEDFADLCDFLIANEGEQAQKLVDILHEEMKRLVHDADRLIRFDTDMAKGLARGIAFMDYVTPPYLLYFLPKLAGIPEEHKRKWILISGLLQRSDHFASYFEEEHGEGTLEPEIEPVRYVQAKKKVCERIFGFGSVGSGESHQSFWQQEEVEKRKDKNVILVAPTGYGKTEFGFLWGSDDKFFYTLPLRSAVNQIFKRATQIFGTEKTGLLHSDADVFLLGDGAEEQKSMKAYELARQLAYPVIIATGDQFFPYALRPPGYERIYATFSYSRLLVDEVQAYDPRACAIVVKFIEDVVQLGGKFLLMTATLPEFVRAEIVKIPGRDAVEELNLYSKNEKSLKEVQKHMLKVEVIDNDTKDGKPEFDLPTEVLQRILVTAKEDGGRRVLVIMNTVKQAVKVFDALIKLAEDWEFVSLKDRIWLLHSRFTLEDRKAREEIVEKEFRNPKESLKAEGGKVLVATQIVEASLDIDSDVLFTEVAPLDALVQRMGRVLRRFGPGNPPPGQPEKPNVIVWVFRHGLQSGGSAVYDNELVLLTLKILSEMGVRKNSDSVDPNELKRWLEGQRKKAKKGEESLILDALDETFGSPTKKHARKTSSSMPVVHDSEGASSKAPLFICSEYDKFVLVKRLYEALSEEGGYKRKFYDTKKILDAGYMAEHKDEAHKVFREISTVPAIAKSKTDEFLNSVMAFFADGEPKHYAHFKRDVLAKFVFHIRVHELGRIGIMSVTDLTELFNLCVSDDDKKRLVRWCKDVWVVDGNYDETKGFTGESVGSVFDKFSW